MEGWDIEFLEHLDSELTTVETRQMDSLIKVLLDGEEVLVHCEFQTTDSTHADMVECTVDYLGRCYGRLWAVHLFTRHLPTSECG